MYDSKADTLEHIRSVSSKLSAFAKELLKRGQLHDQSKLEAPEKEAFDQFTPDLRKYEYGSVEYKNSLAHLAPALNHHYQNNSHHPEHYPNGIDGMTLFDLVEMFCDWRAATERTRNGDIMKSILINEKRFNMSPQLASIFINTVKAIENGKV